MEQNTNNNELLISVIVPVYNVEKYLRKCIDSILQQTYTNLEIILVDDGSPDNCGRICDEYAQSDSRVKVIHKQNGGLSDARNAGIDIAEGDYINFVDSDDYIAPNMLKHLMDKIKQYDADISLCTIIGVNENYAIRGNIQDFLEKDTLLSNIESMELTFIDKSNSFVSACAKIYKAWLLKQTGIRFPEGRLYEDMFTTYKLFFHAKRVVLSNREMYFCLKRTGSITLQGFSEGQLDMITACSQAIDFVKNYDLPLEKQVHAQLILASANVFHRILCEQNWREWTKNMPEIRQYIFSTVPKPFSNPYLPARQRINLAFLKIGLWCYIPLYRMWLFLKRMR